jgi:hypothetical protein
MLFQIPLNHINKLSIRYSLRNLEGGLALAYRGLRDITINRSADACLAEPCIPPSVLAQASQSLLPVKRTEPGSSDATEVGKQ